MMQLFVAAYWDQRHHRWQPRRERRCPPGEYRKCREDDEPNRMVDQHYKGEDRKGTRPEAIAIVLYRPI